MGDNRTSLEVRSACPKPCAVCPWRVANQGASHPHNFYTTANLKRLWRGLRSGIRMSCHETDPRMAEFPGYEALADRKVVRECAGALVLQQRELMRFQEIARANPNGNTFSEYRKQRPKGMTRRGLSVIVERAVFGGTPLDRVAMAQPDLSDSEVGFPLLDEVGKLQ